jgi:hypothetical protein
MADIFTSIWDTLLIVFFLVIIIGGILFWRWFTDAVNEMNAHLERIEYLMEYLTEKLEEEDKSD